MRWISHRFVHDAGSTFGNHSIEPLSNGYVQNDLNSAPSLPVAATDARAGSSLFTSVCSGSGMQPALQKYLFNKMIKLTPERTDEGRKDAPHF